MPQAPAGAEGIAARVIEALAHGYPELLDPAEPSPSSWIRRLEAAGEWPLLFFFPRSRATEGPA